MSDFTTPVQFQINAQATVQKLNSFINQAVLDKSFISGKNTLDNADLDILNDLVLIYDASASNLKNATASNLVDACLTNKFRGKIYAPSTSVAAGININSDEVTGDIVTEPGDLIISNDNFLFVTSDNKLLPILDTGENYFKNPVIIKNPTPASLTAVNSTGEDYVAFGVNNQGEDKSNSFIILWSGNAGIGVSPSTSQELSIGSGGLKFKDGTIQTVSGNNGTGLPNTLVENGSTVNQNTWYNWQDPNQNNPSVETKEFTIKLDWGLGDPNNNYNPNRDLEAADFSFVNSSITGTDVDVSELFPTYLNIPRNSSKFWKANTGTLELIEDAQVEDFYWCGPTEDIESVECSAYKGYQIWKFSSYPKSLTTISQGEVHTANSNQYNIPQKSWMFRDNSTGFIQQWILLTNTSPIDPPQNVGTNESPSWNKVYKLTLPTAFPNACFGVTVVPERNNVSTASQFSTPDSSYYQLITIGQGVSVPGYAPSVGSPIQILTYVKVPEVVKPALYGQWNADIDVDIDGNLNTIVLSNSQLDVRSNLPHGYFKGGVLIYAYGY
ncbi:MAG: hypothetical protein EB127_05340 [Alphaproteobacteria bacterium]|nr:hypothetical protein [Alphaproteobacteria bacterium]